MNRIKYAVICSVLTFLLIYVPLSVANSQPTAIQFKHRLDRADICNHGPIYSEMLQDTSVMEHPAIQKKFVRLAKYVWFERYIKGNMLDLTDNKIECDASRDLTGRIFGQYRQLALELEGQSFVNVWLHITPRSGYKVPNEVAGGFKKRHSLFLQKFFKMISLDDDKGRDGDRVPPREILTGSGSFGGFSRVLYEVVRYGWADLNPGMKNRIENFAQDALVMDTIKIPGFKTFAMAFLLDRGGSESKLRNEIVQPPIHSYDDHEIIEFYIDRIVEDANMWRSEYPKWPVGESEDDDSHKNDRGKGHDKQKGQGH